MLGFARSAHSPMELTTMKHPCQVSGRWLAMVCVFALPCGDAMGQWATDAAANLAVAAGPGEQVLPKLAVTNDGSTYVGWFDSATGAYAVRLQRLDAAGAASWGPGGLLVSANPQSTSLVDWDLIADSAGDCVLVFTDTRDGGDLDVFAYKVSAAGAMMWGQNGVQLSFDSDYDPSPKLTETTTGDVVVVWSRFPSVGDGSARMQRLSAAGVPQLAVGGVAIVSAAGEAPAVTDVVASENGDVIISWVRSIKTFSSPRHLRARRFAANASSPWASHVNLFDATSLPIAHWPSLAADGSGGAVACWHRSDGGGTFNGFIQRFTSAGAEYFAHNGVAVATTTTNHIDPAFWFDPVTQHTTIVWNERNATQSQWGIYGQRIDASGTRMWGAGGKPFVPVDTIYKYLPRIVGIGDDVIVTYAEEPLGPTGDARALAFRADALGNFVWSGSPRVIASTLSSKVRLPTVIDCTGNVRVAWEDDRNGTPDLYAQAIHHDGALGAAPSPFVDLGAGLAGTVGVPNLFGSGNLCASTSVTLTLESARPNSTFALIFGAASAYVPLLGGTLVPVPSFVFPGLPTGPSGSLPLFGTWPVGVPSGLTIYFQAWVVDPGGVFGVAASNGLAATSP